MSNTTRNGAALDPNDSSLSSWFNPQLNHEQREAVAQVVRRSTWTTSQPFVIFGPPGTGKTSTVVEAVLQSLKAQPAGKILVTAPSNAAADVLLARLAQFVAPLGTTMFRMNAHQRSVSDVPAEVLPFCSQTPEGFFAIPEVEQLAKFDVIVATCAMASKLYFCGMPAGHFAQVFVDECGHCTEPEAVAAFVFFSTERRLQLVVAGDPQQLGPIVRHPLAGRLGLQTSFLERLVNDCEPYAYREGQFPGNHGHDPRFLVKLVKCYRCHEAIIRVPNELFYRGQLECAAAASVTDSLLGWEGLPNGSFPVLFHGCQGENQRELQSPSWFNVTEAEVVVDYVRRLVRHGVRAEEIGVIAPYHKQVQKLRKALERVGHSACTVGSCEQFQGQERRVIILSCVRSTVELAAFDKVHNIGFLDNPKRFNVAVTRAKALVIAVGNPFTLMADRCWGALLRHCIANGGYRGVEFRFPTAEEEKEEEAEWGEEEQEEQDEYPEAYEQWPVEQEPGEQQQWEQEPGEQQQWEQEPGEQDGVGLLAVGLQDLQLRGPPPLSAAWWNEDRTARRVAASKKCTVS